MVFKFPWQQAGSRGSYPLEVFVKDHLLSPVLSPPPDGETSVETILVAATSTTLPSPDLPPLHSALGKKQFCWEERDKLLQLPWVQGAKSWQRGVQIWAAQGMAGYIFLPGFLNPIPKPSPSCQQPVSATSPLIFPKQLLLCHCHFTKENSLPHPVLVLLGERRKGGEG